MTIDPTTTIAQAWADDRARLLAAKEAMQVLEESLSVEVDLYIDSDAKATARHLVSEFSMKYENIDRVVEKLDTLIP